MKSRNVTKLKKCIKKKLHVPDDVSTKNKNPKWFKPWPLYLVGGHQQPTFPKGHVNSPSQKGHFEPPGAWYFRLPCIQLDPPIIAQVTCAFVNSGQFVSYDSYKPWVFSEKKLEDLPTNNHYFWADSQTGGAVFLVAKTWKCAKKFPPRWFNVTFSSPSWRYLTIWKGHLTIPKRSLWITRSFTFHFPQTYRSPMGFAAVCWEKTLDFCLEKVQQEKKTPKMWCCSWHSSVKKNHQKNTFTRKKICANDPKFS